MKATYVILLVVLAAIALEARSPLRSDDVDESRLEAAERMLELALERREPSICPHCAAQKAGCYCSYRKRCVDWFCRDTGACTKSNCKN